MIIYIKLIVTVRNINTKTWDIRYTVSVLINLRFFLH